MTAEIIAWVAEMVADDPDRCLKYLVGGKDEKLKAAFTTYLCAVRPDLMEEKA